MNFVLFWLEFAWYWTKKIMGVVGVYLILPLALFALPFFIAGVMVTMLYYFGRLMIVASSPEGQSAIKQMLSSGEREESNGGNVSVASVVYSDLERDFVGTPKVHI